MMRSEGKRSNNRWDRFLCISIRKSGGIVYTLLVVLSVLLSGCAGEDPYQDLKAEDAAFMRAADELPYGAWAGNVLAEGMKDYDEMYQIAKTQKEIDEQRIQILRPMHVSAEFEDIKEEMLLSDEFGAKASEYEMNRALALNESNPAEEDHNWKLEQDAMDESINHSAQADKILCERYGLRCFITLFS